MIKNFLKKNWQLLIVNILPILIFIICYGKFGNVIVDTFREAYIPQRVLEGKVLYKDIFTIYTPFAYLFNALLFYIFGAKLKILAFSGLITTNIILNLIFKIANKFMPKTYSLAVILFIIATGILSPNVFNFIMPYSFGLLYGIMFILGSIYMILKRNYAAGYFLYSLAACSKYEFALFLPVLLWADFKQEKFTKFYKKLSLLFIPILSLGLILYYQGIKLDDIIVSIRFMIDIASAKTLHWFYTISGLIFRPELIPIYFINIVILAIPLLILHFSKKWYIYALIYIYCYCFCTSKILIYIFPLIFIGLLIQYKKLNFHKKFLIISSLIISAKVFSAMTLLSYGTFFTPFSILCIIILAPKACKKNIVAIIFILAFVFGTKNLYALSHKTVKINTEKGTIYADSFYGNTIKNTISYLKANTDKNTRIVVYPEGLIINFLSNRESDNKFYSLIPLYTETFGEELIIKRLKITKPEYIIISNYDTSDYYFKQFGNDYGKNIYKFILSEYLLQKEIGKEFKFSIFKLK